MTDEQILNIFYNKIVPEAQNGRIDCYFIMNMTFNLTIDNTEISICNELPDGVLVPTLKITNKKYFDDALIEYVNRALDFYDTSDFSFIENLETDYSENINMSKSECLIKYVICTLLANASYDDFANPVKFINSRIAMFENKIINHEGELDLGYINSIGARICLIEEKSPIKSETPYRIKSYLEFDDGYKLLLPEIYAGNTGEKYQLYGIQKTTKNAETDERPYLKQIRKGLIAKINGAPEHYFLTVMLFLTLCSDKEIEVIPFLIERWNAKRIAIHNKAKHNPNFSLIDNENAQELIQSNITDIFIRYFKKLEDVSTGIDFYAVPFEFDSNLHIKMEEDFESRSVAFNELFKLSNDYKHQSNKFGK